MDSSSGQPTFKELPATCKGALKSPYTVDSNAVHLSIDPFDYVNLEQHFQSTVRNCVAAPFDLRTDQKGLEVVPCSECPLGFQEVPGINSLMCSPSAFEKAPGNAEMCTTCQFRYDQPGMPDVPCDVCMDSRVSPSGTCLCVM